MINRKKLSQIKCIVAEVDGVLTDGKTWLGQNGLKQRKFSVRDSMSIRRLLKAGYAIALVSKNLDKEITEHFELLGVKNFIQVFESQLDLSNFLETEQLATTECAFIHFSSFSFRSDFGICAAVPTAASEIRTSVEHVTGSEGGEGALSEFAQLILDHGSYSSTQMTARKAANI